MTRSMENVLVLKGGVAVMVPEIMGTEGTVDIESKAPTHYLVLEGYMITPKKQHAVKIWILS